MCVIFCLYSSSFNINSLLAHIKTPLMQTPLSHVFMSVGWFPSTFAFLCIIQCSFFLTIFFQVLERHVPSTNHTFLSTFCLAADLLPLTTPLLGYSVTPWTSTCQSSRIGANSSARIILQWAPLIFRHHRPSSPSHASSLRGLGRDNWNRHFRRHFGHFLMVRGFVSHRFVWLLTFWLSGCCSVA